jgi:cell wall-associated NlpC family hydrolase
MNILQDFITQSIGAPFVENGRTATEGWDCWGLCVEAFKRKGIDLSVFEQIETHDFQSAVKEIDKQVKNWQKIELGQERPWDVVHMRPAHLGIVIGEGRMLHVIEGVETCICSYRHPDWRSRILGFYRHGQLS